MLYLGIIIFVLFSLWIYYKVGVYATPLGGAFLLGWGAHALIGHWMVTAGAALVGWALVYFILGVLRGMRPTWPFARFVEMALVFVPSALFFGGLVQFYTEGAGKIESIVLGVIAGVAVGAVAWIKHEARMLVALEQRGGA